MKGNANGKAFFPWPGIHPFDIQTSDMCVNFLLHINIRISCQSGHLRWIYYVYFFGDRPKQHKCSKACFDGWLDISTLCTMESLFCFQSITLIGFWIDFQWLLHYNFHVMQWSIEEPKLKGEETVIFSFPACSLWLQCHSLPPIFINILLQVIAFRER